MYIKDAAKKHSFVLSLIGLDHDSRNFVSNSFSEIEHFLKLPFITKDKDPLQWWHGHRTSLPCMYIMACDYLGIPTSSVPPEQTNSAVELTFDDRTKLHSYTFKAEMCLHSWIDLIERSNVLVPEDFTEDYEALKKEFKHTTGDDKIIDYILNDKHGR